MMLLFMQEMLKTFMLVQVFHVLGLNIFVLHFLINWSEKKDGKFIFKKQNISPQIFNIILGNVKLISVIKILIVYFIKIIYSKYLIILTRFIYCENIELKNLQGLDVLKLLTVMHHTFILNFYTKTLSKLPISMKHLNSDEFITLKGIIICVY